MISKHATSKNAASNSCATLITHIASDIEHCKKLLQLLNDEREYLKKRDFDSLDQLIEQKNSALAHLEQSAKTRSHMLEQYAQVNPDKKEQSWQNILEKFNSPELLDHWQTLQKLIKECKTENETNGKAMARSEHTVDRLLGILRGQGSSTNLYTVNGDKTALKTKQQIGEA